MNKHQDNLAFPVGVMVVAFGYAIFFAVYNFGYANGHDANKCKQAHGYNYKNVQWFAGVKK